MFLVAQLCLTLLDHMDCSPPDFSVHRDFPGKSTGVGCHFFLQGIFLTQGSNPDLLVDHVSNPGVLVDHALQAGSLPLSH